MAPLSWPIYIYYSPCRGAYRLKSAQGNKTISALTSLNCPRRVLLTGTPIQNNLQVRLQASAAGCCRLSLGAACGWLGLGGLAAGCGALLLAHGLEEEGSVSAESTAGVFMQCLQLS